MLACWYNQINYCVVVNASAHKWCARDAYVWQCISPTCSHWHYIAVDDTLYSSGGGAKGASITHKSSGCDGHYPHKAIYPGVTQFYFYLARGGQQSTEVQQTFACRGWWWWWWWW